MGTKKLTMRDLVKWVNKRFAFFRDRNPSLAPLEALCCSGMSLMLNRCDPEVPREAKAVQEAFGIAFADVLADMEHAKAWGINASVLRFPGRITRDTKKHEISGDEVRRA